MIVLARTDDARPQRAVGIARTEWDSEPDAIEAAEAFARAFDRWIAGATIDHAHHRTRWMALDGTVSWIERKGRSLVVVTGAPAWAVETLASEVWTHSAIKSPVVTRPAKPPPRAR